MSFESPGRISPNDGFQYFFGYYDVPGFSPDGQKHLCHRVSFRDRLPKVEDVAEIGVFDLVTAEFAVLATTCAWNFQQGSMLQWAGGRAGSIAYNIAGAGGEYQGVILYPDEGTTRMYDRPFAAMSTDGRWALSINFDRMYDFRPGYGYASKRDPWSGEKHPADDGVWLLDLVNGGSRLVFSLADLGGQLAHLSPLMQEKLLINHIAFNPGGTRFVAFVRNFPSGSTGWKTTVITADLQGGNLHVLVPAGYASHYHWRDDTTIAIYSQGPQGAQLYEITDSAAPQFTAIDTSFFLQDGHESYSPDRQWMLYDSYPDSRQIQHLYLYDLMGKRGRELGAWPALPASPTDLRCDFHPRWSPDGSAVSFDSTHEGVRALYLLRVRD